MDQFAGSEVVELAIQIERNGRDFYAALAKSARDPRIAQLCGFLSGEEARHIKAFTRICDAVKGCRAPGNAADEYAAYMHGLAGEHIFTRENTGAGIARRVKSDTEALEKAIRFEKESIVFYTGMRKAVPAREAAAVGALIEQEKKHLVKLTELKERTS